MLIGPSALSWAAASELASSRPLGGRALLGEPRFDPQDEVVLRVGLPLALLDLALEACLRLEGVVPLGLEVRGLPGHRVEELLRRPQLVLQALQARLEVLTCLSVCLAPV